MSLNQLNPAATETREIGMQRAFGYLINETDRLADLYERLSDRLADVLLPIGPEVPAAEPKGTPPQKSVLVSEIENQADKIKRIGNDIQRLLSRLDV